jgi:hypothetical protein
VALAWILTLVVCFLLPLEIFFKGLPGWFLAVLLYILFAFIQQRRMSGRDLRRDS